MPSTPPVQGTVRSYWFHPAFYNLLHVFDGQAAGRAASLEVLKQFLLDKPNYDALLPGEATFYNDSITCTYLA